MNPFKNNNLGRHKSASDLSNKRNSRASRLSRKFSIGSKHHTSLSTSNPLFKTGKTSKRFHIPANLVDVLDDLELQLDFEQFLLKNHAAENLEMWQELNYFRYGFEDAFWTNKLGPNPKDQDKTDDHKQELREALKNEAKNLFSQYIDDDAPKWVCVDNETIVGMREDLEDDSTVVTPTFFERVEEQVFQTMQYDLLPRYLKTVLARKSTM